MAAIRKASVSWSGDLMSGQGQLTAESSGAFRSLPVSWASRAEEPNGKTSPEELLAGAHAACFSMAFSNELAKAGSKPQSLDVTSEVTFDKVGDRFSVVSSKLTVTGRVPGMDPERFAQIANQAKDACPISRALAGNVALSVDAKLEQTVTA